MKTPHAKLNFKNHVLRQLKFARELSLQHNLFSFHSVYWVFVQISISRTIWRNENKNNSINQQHLVCLTPNKLSAIHKKLSWYRTWLVLTGIRAMVAFGGSLKTCVELLLFRTGTRNNIESIDRKVGEKATTVGVLVTISHLAGQSTWKIRSLTQFNRSEFAN